MVSPSRLQQDRGGPRSPESSVLGCAGSWDVDDLVALCGPEVEEDVVLAGVAVEGVRAAAADEDVAFAVLAAAVECVVAGAAEEQIAAAAAVQCVVAVFTDEQVAAAAAGENIVPRIAVK